MKHLALLLAVLATAGCQGAGAAMESGAGVAGAAATGSKVIYGSTVGAAEKALDE